MEDSVWVALTFPEAWVVLSALRQAERAAGTGTRRQATLARVCADVEEVLRKAGAPREAEVVAGARPPSSGL